MFSQSVDHVEKDIESKSNEAWTYKKVFHNQNFVVLSIIDASEKTVTKEDGTTETTKLPPSIKIFGTFSSLEEANRHSKRINTENDFFHVYVADTNEWLPIPPTAEFIEDVEHLLVCPSFVRLRFDILFNVINRLGKHNYNLIILNY